MLHINLFRRYLDEEYQKYRSGECIDLVALLENRRIRRRLNQAIRNDKKSVERRKRKIEVGLSRRAGKSMIMTLGVVRGPHSRDGVAAQRERLEARELPLRWSGKLIDSPPNTAKDDVEHKSPIKALMQCEGVITKRTHPDQIDVTDRPEVPVWKQEPGTIKMRKYRSK